MHWKLGIKRESNEEKKAGMHIDEVELWHDLTCLSIIRTIVTTRTSFYIKPHTSPQPQQSWATANEVEESNQICRPEIGSFL